MTVLFCDIVGSTSAADGADPEDVHATLAPYYTQVRAEIERFGGTVEKFIGDAVMAAFGAPVAHEDDPERAVRAGLRLLDAVDELNDMRGLRLAVRIGIATGQAVVSTGARPERGEGMLAGDVVNVAARLQTSAAPRSVVVGEGTYRAVREVVDFEGLAPVRAKGKAESLPVWRAVEARSRVRDVEAEEPATTPFVGRQLDIEALTRELQMAERRRRPHLVTVVAEAGMGKTRLVREFLATVSASSIQVSTCCPAYGEAAGRRVLTDLVGADIDSDRPAERYDTFLRWRTMLWDAAGDRTLVIHVDDLHWADDLVIDFLTDLLKRADDRGLFLIATARPELLDRRPDWGRGASTSTTLLLPPLSDEETGTLVDGLVGDNPDVRTRLVKHAAGVPLHALELARSSPTSDTPPATLSSVVAARIDTLSRPGRAAILDAAVVGDRFDVDTVAALGGTGRDDTDTAVDELVTRNFAKRTGEGDLQFAHDVVRETAYSLLVRGERARRHLKVATWTIDQGVDADPAWLAHHALSAYDLACAVGDAQLADSARAYAREQAMSAGRQAFGLDNDGALRMFERAVELADPATTAMAYAQVHLGMALFERRRFPEADRALADGLAAVEPSDPLRPEGQIHHVFTKFAIGEDTGPLAEDMETSVAEVQPCVQTVRCRAALAALEMIKQTPTSFAAAVALADDTILMAAEHGLSSYTGMAHGVRGRSRLALGDAGGLDEIRAGYALSKLHDTVFLATGSGGYLPGALHHWEGPQAELDARVEVEGYAEQHGVMFWTSFSVAERVRCLVELGRLRDAIALADTIDLGDEAQPRWGVVQRALALADLGELTLSDVVQVRQTPPASPDDLRHVLGSMLIEAVWTPARVPELVAELGWLSPYSERDGSIELLPRLIRVSRDAGVEGLDVLRRADTSTPLSAALTPHVNGLLDRSPRMLAEAESAWKAMGNRLEAAFAALDLAEARGLVASADEFAHMDMRPWADRARRGQSTSMRAP